MGSSGKVRRWEIDTEKWKDGKMERWRGGKGGKGGKVGRWDSEL